MSELTCQTFWIWLFLITKSTNLKISVAWAAAALLHLFHHFLHMYSWDVHLSNFFDLSKSSNGEEIPFWSYRKTAQALRQDPRNFGSCETVSIIVSWSLEPTALSTLDNSKAFIEKQHKVNGWSTDTHVDWTTVHSLEYTTYRDSPLPSGQEFCFLWEQYKDGKTFITMWWDQHDSWNDLVGI